MSVLYIKEQGAFVAKRGERIIVEKNRKEILDMPMMNVESISVIGNVQLSTQLIASLLERGIDICYFSYNGKYLGHACSDNNRNVFLRLAQYNLYQNIPHRLAQARKIAGNKILNQIAVIENYRWTGIDYDYHDAVEQLMKNYDKLELMETANQILGIEGLSSHIYFNAYGKMFKCRIQFEGRNRRPPKDPVNVILSLGYTFLTKDIACALEAESFEMYLGFLHGLRYGRKSLALDIVESFRQPVIDRLTLRLFNKQMLSELDFDTDGDGITLNESGFKTFCREYQRFMSDTTYTRGKICFSSQIRKQIAELKLAVRESRVYEPYVWRKDDDVRGKL